tara:strand:- start:42 stop:476 length:435 start_codon:yes stop_codon:yes gene_type:complete
MTKSQKFKVEKNSVKTKLLNKNNNEIIKILKRSDYLIVSKKLKVRAQGLNLQARKRPHGEMPSMKNIIRVGFTCSRKVGTAVERNNAKRRLRHVARECLPNVGRPGWDYIIIGHQKFTEEMIFENLKKSFIKAINKLHKIESPS